MSQQKPIQGWVDDLQEGVVFVRFPTLGLDAEFQRSILTPEDNKDLFEGCFMELDLLRKELRMVRIPPPSDEEVQEAIRQAKEWFSALES